MYKFSHPIDQDESRLIQISFDFIEKILIWMSACFSACLLILLSEKLMNCLIDKNIKFCNK